MAAGISSEPLDARSEASSDSGWLDVEPDEEHNVIVSLFDSETFSSLDQMLNHCQEHHGFDLATNVRRLQLDFLGAVKMVNFIRGSVKHGRKLPPTISRDDLDDDALLIPVMENDAVLFSLGDVLEEASNEAASTENEQTKDLLARNEALEAELESLQASFVSYRLRVQRTLDQRWGLDENLDFKPDGPSGPVRRKDGGDYYFESYAAHEIHETMLKDQIRTDAYRDFIYGNKDIFKGKTVLDIGCGTGILSMFCAKAGATRVIAVDKSDIIDKARENVFNNELSDIITCLRGAIEDVTLPVDKVDIIVSEWMGYCLLYEAMLPSVLYARDKYLKPDGLLVPSSATLRIAPVEDQEFVTDQISYWRDVYGFDMKAMQEGVYEEVRIESMPRSSICGEPYPFKTFDLHITQKEDLVFTADWASSLTRKVDNIDGFLIWFDIFFGTSRSELPPMPNTTPEEFNAQKPEYVAFTTGPDNTATHWKQGLLLAAPCASPSELPQGVPVSGNVSFSVLEENCRALKIDVSWATADQKSNQSWELK
ncbi:hypothetical protein HIM_08612 [Hirsutella minnesotensis 3608]|uniref:type I protein arginine methyltransferase n=1 Tax=Hirsutella minnesotensis 3608 TaxID=1043627 RepID=A0A0F7ZH55_9HYPO|nr:hypothetical protein HIM_08612 [Hirsutella minnesotensis 3608]